MSTLVIVIEGGNIVESFSTGPIDFVIVDLDQKEIGEDFITDELPIEVSINRIEEIINSYKDEAN